MLENELRGLFNELASALARDLRPIIHEELKRMIDPLVQADTDLTTAVNADLALVSQLLTAVADSANGISASAAAGDAAAVEAQVKQLNDGVTAAKAALLALQTPPTGTASPAPASPAPASPALASPAPAATA